MGKREDLHRPSAIVPNDYTYILGYLTPGSEPWDFYNMDFARKACEAIQWGRGETKMFGHIGKCGVCGAHFREGVIWKHEPTGALVHMGHDCSDKLELHQSDPDFVAAVESLKKRRKAVFQASQNAVQRQKLLDANPGLEGALARDHHILQDLNRKFHTYHSLSPKQVALALKISHEMDNKPVREEEKHVPAPVGRQVIRGILVSKKSQEGFRGEMVTKITVKVTTPDGVWLCWGSIPGGLYTEDEAGNRTYAERGTEIEFKGTLVAGREPHFAFFKRPADGCVIKHVEFRKAS